MAQPLGAMASWSAGPDPTTRSALQPAPCAQEVGASQMRRGWSAGKGSAKQSLDQQSKNTRQRQTAPVSREEKLNISAAKCWSDWMPAEGAEPLIQTKSVYSPINRHNDGLRILVTRFRGRGLRKTRYDAWMANLGPSERLLKNVRSDRITWSEFAHSYRKELLEPGSIDKRNKTIKNHGQKFTLRLLRTLGRKGDLTLLCHCDEDELLCHRHILRKVLAGKI
jgi:uncharacterized protein YeaO (DUF488 family)